MKDKRFIYLSFLFIIYLFIWGLIIEMGWEVPMVKHNKKLFPFFFSFYYIFLSFFIDFHSSFFLVVYFCIKYHIQKRELGKVQGCIGKQKRFPFMIGFFFFFSFLIIIILYIFL